MLDQMILERIARENRCRIENSDSLPPGYQLSNGKYDICHVVYSGDNGFVYMARDNYTKKCVAIKEFYPRDSIEYNGETIRLKRNKHNQALELDPFTPNKYEQYINLLNRFLQEAERLKVLYLNPYVIDVNDCFEGNNSGYIVLDFIDYPTLSQVMTSDEPLTPRHVVDIFMLIIKAVEEIHGAGFIHRDIKPSNIFVMADKVVIGDFGISKYQRDMNKNLTISYTDNYASPEQKQGSNNQGTWSDIYSLGKILEYLIIHLGYKNSTHIKSRREAYELGLELVDKAMAKQKVKDIISRSCEESIGQRLQNIHELQSIIGKKSNPLTMKKLILPSLIVVLIGLFIFLTSAHRDEMIQVINAPINNSEGGSTSSEESGRDTNQDNNTIRDNMEGNTHLEEVNIEESNAEQVNAEQVNAEEVNVEEVNTEEVNTEEKNSIEESASTERITFKTPENSTYKYTDDKVVEWTNPHKLPGYYVSIINTNTWHIGTQFYVLGASLDLDSLGLNPSSYRLILFVTGPNNEYSYMEYFNFTIEEPTDRSLLSPVRLETDFYSYHQSDNKYIPFYPQNEGTSYQVSLLDYNGAREIVTKEITKQGVNINELYNKSGHFALIIQAKKDQQLSAYTKADISIVEDEIPRRATFNINNNSFFPFYSEKKLEWSNMDEPTEIYMILNHIVSGETMKESFKGDVKYSDLDAYDLKMGAYECTVSYLTKNIMSPYRRIYFSVLPPYLPPVVMNKEIRTEWTLSEAKRLIWSPSEKANNYLINFYEIDSQEIMSSLTTEKTFLDFTDILQKGHYRVEIHYMDERDNPSEKTIFDIMIN